MTEDKLVVALVGMPGSGKSLVVAVARQRGYDVVAMGDVIREEARSRNLQPTPENIGKVMLDLRSREGPAVVAKRCIPRIDNARRDRVLVDGIRSLDEVEHFEQHYPRFTLIAIHSSPETRFRRLYNRRRSDDSGNWKTFDERDKRELSVGLGDAFALAKYIIINEGAPHIVKNTARHVLEKAERK